MPTNKELSRDMDVMKGEINVQGIKLDDILTAIQGMSALDRGTGSTKIETEVTDELISQTKEPLKFVQQDGDSQIIQSRMDAEAPEFKNKQDALAFNEEMVTVRIHETAERFADQTFEIGVNGLNQFFRRGEISTVKRKFVEGLARAKPVHYENKPRTDADGVRSVHYIPRRGLRYPFDVVEDKNPRGKAWLESRLRAA